MDENDEIFAWKTWGILIGLVGNVWSSVSASLVSLSIPLQLTHLQLAQVSPK